MNSHNHNRSFVGSVTERTFRDPNSIQIHGASFKKAENRDSRAEHREGHQQNRTGGESFIYIYIY
jgi:hypothetical protein